MGVSAVGVSAVGVYQQYIHFGKLFRHTMHNYKGRTPNDKIRHDENGGKSLTISYKSLIFLTNSVFHKIKENTFFFFLMILL